jgi:hypothetical protein
MFRHKIVAYFHSYLKVNSEFYEKDRTVYERGKNFALGGGGDMKTGDWARMHADEVTFLRCAKH